VGAAQLVVIQNNVAGASISVEADQPVIAAIPVLVVRILDEEKLLRTELPGHPEYTAKIHYRLVPGLW